MSTLKDLVAKHIPIDYRMRYDFSSHWIPWINDVLKLIAQMVKLEDNVSEIGVEVIANRWIKPPVKCRKALEVYTYEDKNSDYKFDITDRKLKLRDNFPSGQKVSTEFELQENGSVKAVPSNLFDSYEGALIITNSETHIITHSETIAGDLFLFPLNEVTNIGADPITGIASGYIIEPNGYLLLKCVCDYPEVTSENDEVPLSDKYEKALSTGLRLEIMKEMEDLSQIGLWLTLMKWELGLLDLDSGLLKELKKITRDNEVKDASKA